MAKGRQSPEAVWDPHDISLIPSPRQCVRAPTRAPVAAPDVCGINAFATRPSHGPCPSSSAAGSLEPCQVSGLRMKFPKNRVFNFDIEYFTYDEEDGWIDVSTCLPKRTCPRVLRLGVNSCSHGHIFSSDGNRCGREVLYLRDYADLRLAVDALHEGLRRPG